MPRGSSGGRSASRSAPRPVPMRNPPRQVSQAPPPAPVQSRDAVSQVPPPAPVQSRGSVGGGIGGAIADGMMWGTGSAIGHRAVDAVLGPRTIYHETVVSSAPAAEAVPAASAGGSMGSDSCIVHSKAFQDCINSNGSDIGKCQFYLDMLNECRRGSTLAA